MVDNIEHRARGSILAGWWYFNKFRSNTLTTLVATNSYILGEMHIFLRVNSISRIAEYYEGIFL